MGELTLISNGHKPGFHTGKIWLITDMISLRRIGSALLWVQGGILGRGGAGSWMHQDSPIRSSLYRAFEVEKELIYLTGQGDEVRRR